VVCLSVVVAASYATEGVTALETEPSALQSATGVLHRAQPCAKRSLPTKGRKEESANWAALPAPRWSRWAGTA